MNTQKVFGYGTQNLFCAFATIVALALAALSLAGCPTEPDPGTTTGGDTTAPVLSAESVKRTSDTAATIGFTSSEAGTAYYLVAEKDAAAPTNTAVKAANNSFAVTAGANSGKTVTLTAGAKDIYIVVQDAAGNISVPLKIEAAAYDPDSGDPECECNGVEGDCDCGAECDCPVCEPPHTPDCECNGVEGDCDCGAECDCPVCEAPHIHTYGLWVETDAATETEDGEETRTCTDCVDNPAHTETRPLYATGTEGLEFEIIDDGGDNDGTYRVSGFTDEDADAVHIPAYHRPAGSTDYLPVTEIGDYAFSSLHDLISISIPASVTAFGDGVFDYCISLETVTFAANSRLTTIGYGTFMDCNNLASIIIPTGVTEIGGSAFHSCTSLISITIPAGVMVIGDNAFSNCSSLETVTFEANSQLTTIGWSAFENCQKITVITIPASVTTVGGGAFVSWTSAQTINVPFANVGATPSGWDADWLYNCNATIKYWNGSSYQ